MNKFCLRPRSKSQKQVKNGQQNIKICLFSPDFKVILPLKFGRWQNLFICLILNLVIFIWMENVWLELWQFHWKLFSILNSVVIEGILLKSNKHPALNECPEMKKSLEFWVEESYYLTFFSYFDLFCLKKLYLRKYFKESISILPLIRISWEEKWGKTIRMSWTTIRKTRVLNPFSTNVLLSFSLPSENWL